MPYLTPATLPSSKKCRILHIPDDMTIAGAVLGAISQLGYSRNWEQFGAITPNEIAEAMVKMVQSYVHSSGCMIGLMSPYPGLEIPSGTLPCDGATYNRVDFPELYEYLTGTDYIINDDQFVTPTFPGRAVVMPDEDHLVYGEFGAGTHTLTIDETAPHDHTESVVSITIGVVGEIPALVPTGGGGVTGTTGGGEPHNNYQPSIAFNWCIVSGRELTVEPVTTFHLFNGDVTYQYNNSGDALNLGVRFHASENGFITGGRLWVLEEYFGARSLYLWTNSGTLLATATFPAITETGWLEVLFDDPVDITASVNYVMSIASTGQFVSTLDFFASEYANDPLFGNSDGDGGANGLYSTAAAGTFPTSTFSKSNYWISPILSVG